MMNVKLKEVILLILFMAILVTMISINKKLSKSNYIKKQYISADWCSKEIDILREQVSDIWYNNNLDE